MPPCDPASESDSTVAIRRPPQRSGTNVQDEAGTPRPVILGVLLRGVLEVHGGIGSKKPRNAGTAERDNHQENPGHTMARPSGCSGVVFDRDGLSNRFPPIPKLQKPTAKCRTSRFNHHLSMLISRVYGSHRSHPESWTRCSADAPITAVGRMPWSKVTNRPLFLTASASRYRSVICFGPSNSVCLKISVSVRLSSSGQKR